MRSSCLAPLPLIALFACGDDHTHTPAIDAPAVVDAAVTIDAAAADAPSADAATVDAPTATDARIVDAPVAIDAAAAVVEVPCPASVASEVTAPGFAFTITDSTVAVGAVVRFTMPASHSAVSGATPGVADGLFTVGFNQTKCLRFTVAGTYPFWCNPHQFTGSITVGP